jgi:hypothetical protein
MAKAKSASGVNPALSSLTNAALTIGARLDAMLAYEAILHKPDEVYELHQMRIAAKRLRYTMEIFQGIYADYTPYGKTFDAAIESVRSLQEHLGEIHDADVLVPQLTEHLARLLRDGYGENRQGEPLVGVHRVDFDACEGLLTLCQQVRADRDQRYAQLREDWKQLRDRQTFENLRALLEDAIAAKPPPAKEEGGSKKEGDEETPSPPKAVRPAPRRTRRRLANDHEHEP